MLNTNPQKKIKKRTFYGFKMRNIANTRFGYYRTPRFYIILSIHSYFLFFIIYTYRNAPINRVHDFDLKFQLIYLYSSIRSSRIQISLFKELMLGKIEFKVADKSKKK